MNSISKRNFSNQTILISGIALIVLSTLIRGANRNVALLSLEAVSLLILCMYGLLFLKRSPNKQTDQKAGLAVAILIFSPAIVAALQLSHWFLMSDRPLSLTPLNSWASSLTGITIATCFVMGLWASVNQSRFWLGVWLTVALFQASLGLLQMTGFEGFYFGDEMKNRVIGSFSNRNHLADFLAMAIPLVILNLKKGPLKNDSTKSVWFWVSALFILWAAILATLSRAGISIALITSTVSLLLIGDKRVHKQSLRWGAFALVSIIALALLAGGLDWLDRFDSDQLEAAATIRSINRDATWQAAKYFWPWGSGLGSFSAVFPAHQPAEVGGYLVDYAHSDYLQLLMEMGILFLVFGGLVIWLIARRTGQIWRSGRMSHARSESDRLAIACGLGVLAIALHAWVDFPMRIPANAMFAAFLFGVFLREPTQKT